LTSARPELGLATRRALALAATTVLASQVKAPVSAMVRWAIVRQATGAGGICYTRLLQMLPLTHRRPFLL
jgi:hypothetical protein